MEIRHIGFINLDRIYYGNKNYFHILFAQFIIIGYFIFILVHVSLCAARHFLCAGLQSEVRNLRGNIGLLRYTLEIDY